MQREQITAGATSQTIDVFVYNGSLTTGLGLTGLAYNSASLVASYRKGATGTCTAITLATQTVAGAFSSGGFVEIDATNMPGWYRLDLPDAAVDTAGRVYVMLKGATNMVPVTVIIDCTLAAANVTAIAAGAITAAAIATDAIDADAIAANAIDAGAIATGAITAAKFAAGAIDADAIAADAITNAKVASDVIIASVTGAVGSVTGAVGSVATGVTVTTNNDKTGYALTADERTAIANAVETEIINEADSEKVLTAITDKIASVNPDLGGLTVNAIASAVWASVSRTLSDKTGFSLATDAVNTDALAATAISEITSGLATATNVTTAQAALEVILTAIKGATFDTATDSLEQLRNQGDSAWATGTAPDNAGIAAAQAAAETLRDSRLTVGRAAALDSIDATVSSRATPAQVATQVESRLTADRGEATDITSRSIAGILADLWQRHFGKVKQDKTTGKQTVYKDDGTTVLAQMDTSSTEDYQQRDTAL